MFVEYGSPYTTLVGLVDGNFLRFCRPRGLGNKRSRLDQRQLYSGEKCAHGIKHLAAFFQNGMMALFGPFLGSVGDGRMVGESNWLNMLRRACLRDGNRYKLFGDAAFGISNYIQSMLKGEAAIRPDGRAFNALMSRITHQLGHALHMEIEDLLELCPTAVE